MLRNAARFITGKILPRTAYPVLRGPMRGVRFVLGSLSGEGSGASVYLNACEPEQVAAFARTFKSGDVFFDIGANVGLYTVFGSKLVGPNGAVIAFEPVLRNLYYLRQHLLLNKCRNVAVVSAACSDSLSLATFAMGDSFATGHLNAENESLAKFTPREASLVSTVTIDAVAEKTKLVPQIVKIDVEGAELAVLHGAHRVLQRAKPKIFLSVHSDDLRRDCLAYLETLNYSAEPLNGNRDTSTEFLVQ